jgi:hypothetical protein
VPFLKLDDNYPTERRVKRLSDGAFRLHAHALHYIARNLDDGLIDAEDVNLLTRHDDVETYVSELLESGLWLAHEDAYLLPDFLKWNRTREQVERDQANAKRRKDDWIERQRQAKEKKNAVPNGVQNAAHPIPSLPLPRGEGKEEGPAPPGSGNPTTCQHGKPIVRALDGTTNCPDCADNR